MELKFTVPIYYLNKFKTKPDENLLIWMNWYRNVHYTTNNKIKQHYKTLCPISNKKFDKATVHYDVYLKDMRTDGPNVRSVIEKYVLDWLISRWIIKDDNLNIIIWDSARYYLDKENPRCEITLKSIDI